jgi:hypothetical protein
MSAPVLAEGRPTFEHRAGGDFIVITWPNGASVMLSRHDAAMTSRTLGAETRGDFTAQPARIVALHQQGAMQ